MRLIGQKQITITSNTYEIFKKPTAKNENSGHISIDVGLMNKLSEHDFFKINVLSQNDDIIHTGIYSKADIKRRSTNMKKYFLFRYS
jgi:glutaredoxin-related protein